MAGVHCSLVRYCTESAAQKGPVLLACFSVAIRAALGLAVVLASMAGDGAAGA